MTPRSFFWPVVYDFLGELNLAALAAVLLALLYLVLRPADRAEGGHAPATRTAQLDSRSRVALAVAAGGNLVYALTSHALVDLALYNRLTFPVLTTAVSVGGFVLAWRLADRPTTVAVAAATTTTTFGLALTARYHRLPFPDSNIDALLVLVAVLALAVWFAPSLDRSVFLNLLERTPPAMLAVAACSIAALPRITGGEVRGAYIVVSTPIGPLQPQDFARVLVVVWLADVVARNREHLGAGPAGPTMRDRASYVLDSVLVLAPALVIMVVGVANNDFGPILGLAVSSAVVLAMVGTRRVVWAASVAASAAAVLAVAAISGKVRERFELLADPVDADGQLSQAGSAVLGIAHGSWGGAGVGQGLPGAVPAFDTDLFFVSAGEELGAVHLLLLLGVNGAFLVAGAQLTARTTQPRRHLLAGGLVALLAAQMLVAVGGGLGLLPLTGVPQPFTSTSGTSLATSWFALGLLLAATRATPPGPGRPDRIGKSGVRNGRLLTLGVALSVAVLSTQVVVVAARGGSIVAAHREHDVRTGRAVLYAPPVVTADGVVLAETRVPTADDYRPATRRAALAHGQDLAMLPARPANAVRWRNASDPYHALLGATSTTFWSGLSTRPEVISPAGSECSRRDPRYGGSVTVNGRILLAGLECEPVRLSLRDDVQQLGWRLLAGRPGAVVVADLQTGGLLAWVSSAGASGRDGLGTRDPAAGVFTDRATTPVPPGSVMKIATVAAAVDGGLRRTHPEVLEHGPASSYAGIRAHGAACGSVDADLTLVDLLAVSCNPSAARIGGTYGADAFASLADPLLNQQRRISGVPVSPSRGAVAGASALAAAQSAIGSGDASVTPMAILQLTCQVALRGGQMQLTLLPGSDEAGELQPVPMSREAAAIIASGMTEAVRTGTAATVEGFDHIDGGVAAKTATSDYAPGASHGLITAYAPIVEPRYAVTVLVASSPERPEATGARDAGPVAAGILQELLG